MKRASSPASSMRALQPVQAGVGIRAPDGFDERADHVVVLVFPVAQGTGAAGGLDVGHAHGPTTARFGQGQGYFEAVQGGPSVALDEARQEFEHTIVDRSPFVRAPCSAAR